VYAAQIDASRELSRAEIRRFVAQTASTTSRMAAALSHELNTPVGTMKSSIDTLGALAARRHGASETQLHRIDALEQQVLQSARDAALRLQKVVQALQRVTNLDRAEIQNVDVNALLKDVLYLLESQMRLLQSEVELVLGSDLPGVRCRPQQISAVLSNVFGLVSESKDSSRVHVETRSAGREVEILFRGSSTNLRSSETQAIFDPGFAERSGRVVASSWGLFMARQVVREHGGEMRMERGDHAQTTIVLTLPAARDPDSAQKPRIIGVSRP
jgi:K+-sensing histidine kinase KdpD